MVPFRTLSSYVAMWLPPPVSKMALEFCKCGLAHKWGLDNVCKVSAAHLGRCHFDWSCLWQQGADPAFQRARQTAGTGISGGSCEVGAVRASVPDKLDVAIKEVREKVLLFFFFSLSSEMVKSRNHQIFSRDFYLAAGAGTVWDTRQLCCEINDTAARVKKVPFPILSSSLALDRSASSLFLLPELLICDGWKLKQAQFAYRWKN